MFAGFTFLPPANITKRKLPQRQCSVAVEEITVSKVYLTMSLPEAVEWLPLSR